MDDDLFINAYEGMSESELLTLENADAESVAEYTATTDGKTSFSRLARLMHKFHRQLPHEHHNLYRLWLLTKPLRKGENTKTKAELWAGRAGCGLATASCWFRQL